MDAHAAEKDGSRERGRRAAATRSVGGGRRGQPARSPSLARTLRTRQLSLDSESTSCPALLPTSPPVRFAAPASSSPALISRSPPTSLNSPRPPRAAMKATIPRRALADVLKRRPDDVVVRPLSSSSSPFADVPRHVAAPSPADLMPRTDRHLASYTHRQVPRRPQGHARRGASLFLVLLDDHPGRAARLTQRMRPLFLPLQELLSHVLRETRLRLEQQGVDVQGGAVQDIHNGTVLMELGGAKSGRLASLDAGCVPLTPSARCSAR